MYFALLERNALAANNVDFLRQGVNYLSVAIRIMYVFFAGAAMMQSIIYEDEEGTLGLVRFGSTSVARTRGWRACAN